MKKLTLLATAAVALAAPAASVLAAPQSPVIPRPAEVQVKKGQFVLTADTVIVAPDTLANEAAALRDSLAPATGFKLSIQAAKSDGKQIMLALDPALKNLGREGYTLQVVPRGAVVKSSTSAGVFYGIQSLLQMLPPEIASAEKADAAWEVPCVSITDQPRFAWRAFMLDEARHFKGEKVVKKLLDQMAALKMNVFHWHLTDDQGWRIEIKKYPKLTSVGSKRKDTQTGTWGSPTRTGKPHSGFYTQDQIRDIVAYAKKRHITIVPEIGMPGHACAAIAAYPELGTNKKPIEVMTVFGKAFDTYDPAAETTYRMLSDILDEVIALFPSKIIHIGGDEVRFDHWKKSEAVKELMKREKLKTMADVQLYFTNRMAGIVQKKGRNIMGWNEILGENVHGGLNTGANAESQKLDKDTVVHFWKGSTDLAKRAVKAGHTIVNSLHSFTYLDYSYAQISLEKAYNFNPIIGGLTPAEEKRIIGTGCQMWSEWIPTVADMERQVFPRIAAYAEVGWTQKNRKDYASFKHRLKRMTKRWDLQGIGYAAVAGDTYTAKDFFNYTKVDSWSPEKTPAEPAAVTFSTGGAVKSAGSYELAFVYQRGAHALAIRTVELLEDGKPVARDSHPAMSGSQLVNVAYSLKPKKYNPSAKYTLRVTASGAGGTDSHGEVKIRRAD